MKLYRYTPDLRGRLPGVEEFHLPTSESWTVRSHYRWMRDGGLTDLRARVIIVDLLKAGRWGA